MATDYTTAAAIDLLAGSQAVDLRTDDGTEADMVNAAIAYAGGRIDFFCHRYSATVLAANQWVQDVATLLALRWLCMRRLNEVPSSIEDEYAERLEELKLVQQGKAEVPGAATGRRPITVTNPVVDLRKTNNHVRTDQARSTGLARDYYRPTDPGTSRRQ
jgi:phage gp36-like protein